MSIYDEIRIAKDLIKTQKDLVVENISAGVPSDKAEIVVAFQNKTSGNILLIINLFVRQVHIDLVKHYTTDARLYRNYITQVSKTFVIDFENTVAWLNYVDDDGNPTGVMCEVYLVIDGKKSVQSLFLRNNDLDYQPYEP